MTISDPWGMPISCTAEVAPTYGEAMRRSHDRRSGDVELLQQVVAGDPGFAVGRATAALWAVFTDAPFDVQAELAAARAGRQQHEWERSYVAAVVETVDRGQWPAMPTWLAHHDAHPGDLMGAMVAAFLLEMSAEPDGAAEGERRVARTMDAVGEDPMLLGYLAMTAQDRGDLDAAHRLATRSLELDPTGFAGGHPIAHVYFETADHANGLTWLDGWLPTTDQKAMFGRHLVWHAALHHLALGDGDGALARYPRLRRLDGRRPADRRPVPAVALPAARPRTSRHRPRDPARQRPGQAPVGRRAVHFLGVHVALALATAGDADGLRRFAHNARGFDATGAATLLPDLAGGLAAFVEGDHAKAAEALLRFEPYQWDVGGSHAQREVFEDTLIHALVRAGRLDEAATRLRVRLDRRESALDTGLLAETVSGGRARL